VVKQAIDTLKRVFFATYFACFARQKALSSVSLQLLFFAF
jgi:hypothetical protein